MNYLGYRRLGITEMKKRLLKASTYWTTKLLNEACKKITNKSALHFFKKKRVLDFLICQYAQTGKLIITKIESLEEK